MIKDLENIKGDLANGYHTIPIVHGELASKKLYFFTCHDSIPYLLFS